MTDPLIAEFADAFVQVPCTLCGEVNYAVLRRPRFDPSMTVSDLRELYSASSDHVLLDQLVRCRACGLIHVNPRIRDSFLLESYAAAIDPVFVSQNDQRIRTFERSLREICKAANLVPSPEVRLLDVGSAGGAFLTAAAGLGFHVTGVEPSHWMSEFARTEYGVDVRTGTLEMGLFPAHSFDVISLWDVIEHLSDPKQMLAMVHGYLKPGGLLIMNYPDVGSVAARALRARWPFYLSVHLSYYTRDTMRLQLDQASFRVIRMTSHWQTLTVGYVLKRLSAYVSPVSRLIPLLKLARLDAAPITYNMGQTLVLARTPSAGG